MERRGISIDRQVLARLSGEFAQEAAGLEDEINTLAGEPLNPGSAQAARRHPVRQDGSAGRRPRPRPAQWSTGARVLEDLAEQGHALPQKILDWRQVSKLRSTYTDALPGFVNPTTAPRPYLLCARRHHHRAAVVLRAQPAEHSGAHRGRPQDPPRLRRRARPRSWSPPTIRRSSCGCWPRSPTSPPLKQAFRDGLDIHAMTASEMFGVPVKDMPGEVRRRAKAINFGIIYGISAFGLANQLGIAREEAGAYIKKYFERFPGIRDYMEDTKEFCQQNGYVVTLFGRKCHYPDIRASNPSIRAFNERAAINARLQGSAADIIRRAMIRMEAALAQNKLAAQMLLQVHDELIFEVPDAEVAKTLPVVKQVMEDAPLPAVALTVPLRSMRTRRTTGTRRIEAVTPRQIPRLLEGPAWVTQPPGDLHRGYAFFANERGIYSASLSCIIE